MTASLDAAASFGRTGSVLGFHWGESRIRIQTRAATIRKGDRDDHVGCDIAEPRHHPRREEGGEGGAAHARTEETGREAALGRRVPGVDERDADRERRAGDAEEEAEDDEKRVRAEGSGGYEKHGDMEAAVRTVNMMRPP